VSKEEQLSRVLKSGIVAIVRSPRGDRLVEVAEALLAGGIDVLEFTFTIPKAPQILEQVADKLGDRVLLGAGTVLDAATARTALLAGAQYIVTPAVKLDVIQLCQRYSKLVMPGALTPTEVLTAWEAGADLVKIFPSEITGPKYLKALHGPFPHIRLMPTGGVNLNTASEFLRSGACSLGIGSSLVEPALLSSANWDALRDLAAQYVKIVRDTRAELAQTKP